MSSAFTAAVNSPSASEADSYGTRDRKRVTKKRRVSLAEEEDDYEDEDAEGEDDDEDLDLSRNSAAAAATEGAPDDQQIFCLCQRVSFGEVRRPRRSHADPVQMVGCDNEACNYEWFHFEVRDCCAQITLMRVVCAAERLACL